MEQSLMNSYVGIYTDFNGSFPPTEMDSDSDPWDGDLSLNWVQ